MISVVSCASRSRAQGHWPLSCRLASSMSTMTMRESGVLGSVARIRTS